AYQPANRDERAGVVERGQPLARGKLDNLNPRLGKERRAQDNQRVGVAAGHFGEGACDLLNHPCRHRERFNAMDPAAGMISYARFGCVGSCGLSKTAIRFACGTTLLSNSTCLPAMSGCCIESPVTLPPGRARVAASPAPIGSAEIAMTTGIDVVACLAARVASEPSQTRIWGSSRTSSAARPDS